MHSSIPSPSRSLAVLLFAILAVLPLAAACGGDDDDSGGEPSPTTTLDGATPTGPQSEHGQLIARARVPLELAEGTSIGKADAPIVIEAYEDFGCPHCLHFTAVIEPKLMDDYIARGKVRLVYRYLPLQQATAAAALGAQCAAEQNRFWEYHAALFTAQAEASNKTGPLMSVAFAPAGLVETATTLKLDLPAFDACLQGTSAIEAVQEDLRQAQALGLRGTPSFVVNGNVLTGSPENYDDWKKYLDALLK